MLKLDPCTLRLEIPSSAIHKRFFPWRAVSRQTQSRPGVRYRHARRRSCTCSPWFLTANLPLRKNAQALASNFTFAANTLRPDAAHRNRETHHWIACMRRSRRPRLVQYPSVNGRRSGPDPRPRELPLYFPELIGKRQHLSFPFGLSPLSAMRRRSRARTFRVDPYIKASLIPSGWSSSMRPAPRPTRRACAAGRRAAPNYRPRCRRVAGDPDFPARLALRSDTRGHASN
jgi:hypothetical protein